MIRKLLWAFSLLLLASFPAFAMTVTTVVTAAGGAVTTTTYEISDSLAAQVFPGTIAKRSTIDAQGATVAWLTGFTDASGAVLTIGPGGQVYRDSMRLGTATVSRLVQVGNTLYGLGKTDSKWWRWTGTTWAAVVDFDANILK